jgi:CDGSH iron-sulfur domain-containing protein 3
MATVTIKVLKDGPYQVIGDVELVDADGAPIAKKEGKFHLCRCGGSANKPFCDRTHSRIGFRGAELAVRQAEGQV